jgi:putative ATP-dependent endonuclease of the OLD family
VQIRRVTIERFRGLRALTFAPGPRVVILGPNNAGKSTILEALDLLLHSGLGRPRPSPSEIDYFGRDPTGGFRIEVVLGGLPPPFLAETREYLEGWNSETGEVVPEPEGDGVETVVRVQVRATADLDLVHEFAKPEAAGARFGPRLRSQVGWVFDGRTREPARQLAFYQGAMLERLFGENELDEPVRALRDALAEGAAAVNDDAGVNNTLSLIADDLRQLGLLEAAELPQFEIGAVSKRELLQALRLALPAPDARIPVHRQGRGAQRLLLVSVLLRLAQAAGVPTIGGFEEPEEALEPLRQVQVARLLARLANENGQVFVVTHSPEIARAFGVDDFLLLRERTAGEGACMLRSSLSGPMRQKYERMLDRGVVRALFARVPLLVEGPGDRALIETYWHVLADDGAIPPAEQLGLDVVNCEGAPDMPAMAQLLAEAGKAVAAWAELDRPDVLARLRNEGHCSCLLLHDAEPGRQNLEDSLAHAASLAALANALTAVAEDRSYPWEQQREDLLSRAEHVAGGNRQAMREALNVEELLNALEEGEARLLIAKALASGRPTPFEIKGARPARICAEAIAAVDGVPENFVRVIRGLAEWISGGCQGRTELSMAE